MKTVPVDHSDVVNRNVVEKIKSIKDQISRTAGFW